MSRIFIPNGHTACDLRIARCGPLSVVIKSYFCYPTITPISNILDELCCRHLTLSIQILDRHDVLKKTIEYDVLKKKHIEALRQNGSGVWHNRVLSTTLVHFTNMD